MRLGVVLLQAVPIFIDTASFDINFSPNVIASLISTHNMITSSIFLDTGVATGALKHITAAYRSDHTRNNRWHL